MAAADLVSHRRLCAEDRRQQILDAATELFARQGFGSTTTRQIAERAQVNEAIIFRHFVTKEELYWSVLERKCAAGRGRKAITAYLESGRPVTEVFSGMATDILRLLEADSSMLRLLLFSALEDHELSPRIYEAFIAGAYDATAQYVRRQMQAGVFRDLDPMLAARNYWGMVMYHFLIQDLFGAKRYRQIDPEEAGRTIADAWLKGVLRTAEAGKLKPPPRKPGARASSSRIPAKGSR